MACFLANWEPLGRSLIIDQGAVAGALASGPGPFAPADPSPGFQQPQQDLHQGGLADAVGAHQADFLAPFDDVAEIT